MQASAGIDVSKDHLDLASSGDTSVRRFANTARGVRELVRVLREGRPRLTVLESTGGYERRALDALLRSGLAVARVNPWRVRRFGEGLGSLAKTDAIDAHLLALYADKADPPNTAAPSPLDRELGTYIQRRRQLIAMIVAEKNRLESGDRWLCNQVRDVVRLLERRVVKIDGLIDAAIERDEVRSRRRRILESAPSVGPGIARTLLIDLPELGSLSRKQIASLCGLAPFARDSGRKRGLRSIRAGRAAPRTALYSNPSMNDSARRESPRSSPSSPSPESSSPSSTP